MVVHEVRRSLAPLHFVFVAEEEREREREREREIEANDMKERGRER